MDLRRLVRTLGCALGILFPLVSFHVASASATDGCTIQWDGKNLKGRVTLTTRDGRIFIPRSAKIYVIYQANLNHKALDTADQEYEIKLGQYLKSTTKELHDLQKYKQISSEEARARLNHAAALMLRSSDDALVATMDWAARNPKKSWQVQVLTTDEQGLWSREALTPGAYHILFRADFGNYYATWEVGGGRSGCRPEI